MHKDKSERITIGWWRAVVVGLILALGSGAAMSCKSKAEAETSEAEDGEKDTASAKKKSKKSKAKSEASADEAADAEHAEKPKAKAKESETAEKTEEKAGKEAHASAGHAAPKSEISASDALTLLKEGNAAFVNGAINVNHLSVERRASLASGQHPFAIILSCSDSRVPPEDVFAQGLGDLFTIRVAGNIAEPATVASIEYAAAHLGSALLVVMGHTECGAVKAAIAGAHDTPSITELVKAIQPGIEGVKKDPSNTEPAVRANVSHVHADVLRQSKLLSEMVQGKKLKVVEAVYDLKTGKVKFM